MSDKESHHHTEREIIIVRRRSDGEGEGHHGGVWKIAYADFMTAMMAFFLVMWLVNAANEETKASVASYFNPIKLMDDKPTERGVQEVGESADGEAKAPASESEGEGQSNGASSESGADQNATAGEETQYSESNYFENPYSVLSEIAQETGQLTNISDAGEGGAQTSGPATGASGGEAYRDPFDPDFWSQQIEAERQAAIEQTEAAEEAEQQDVVISEEPTPGQSGAGGTADEPDIATELAATAPDVAENPAEAMPETPAEMTPPAEAAVAEPAEPSAEDVAEAAELREEIETALGGINGKLPEGLEVTPAEGGLLVSLTDQLQYGMFNVGSAVPKRDLVLAMEEIGRLLSTREGVIAIRGHTDARPFQGEGNDNWRLSTDRAHSAYYMLVRGGLTEDRIVQVSGFADRKLKLPDDPFADANRRIEILVQDAGT